MPSWFRSAVASFVNHLEFMKDQSREFTRPLLSKSPTMGPPVGGGGVGVGAGVGGGTGAGAGVETKFPPSQLSARAEVTAL